MTSPSEPLFEAEDPNEQKPRYIIDEHKKVREIQMTDLEWESMQAAFKASPRMKPKLKKLLQQIGLSDREVRLKR